MVTDIEEKQIYLLLSKAVFRFICKLAHAEKPISDYGMDIAERMNSTAKVTTMVDKRIRKASD